MCAEAQPESICWIPEFPVKAILHDSTGSDETLSRISKWTEKCVTEHIDYSLNMSNIPQLPSRVIDVRDSMSTSTVKLLETKGLKGQYICLSHRWGTSEMPITTEKATIEERKRAIPEHSLPLTFRQAIMVTRRMGCDYLWIDSLCIVQDDEEDWQVEAAQMASIHRNSLLTLAAAAASGPTAGLFYTARPELREEKPLELSRFNVPFPVYVRRHMRYEVGHLVTGQEHTLLERGWVLQERLLSPRVVFFGANKVAWECMTCTACECEPDLMPHRIGRYSPRAPLNPKAAFTSPLLARISKWMKLRSSRQSFGIIL